MKVKLIPYNRSKATETTWALKVLPYNNKATKKTLLGVLKKLYPQVEIKRAYICKSIKKNLLVVETKNQLPWEFR